MPVICVLMMVRERRSENGTELSVADRNSSKSTYDITHTII